MAARKAKAAEAARREANRKQKEAESVAAEKAKAEQALVERTFSDVELGQGPKKGAQQERVQARSDFLDRLRVVYGPLPKDVEAFWSSFRDWWAVWIQTQHKDATGSYCLEQLRTIKRKSEPKKAFAVWVRKQWDLKPKPANTEII